MMTFRFRPELKFALEGRDVDDNGKVSFCSIRLTPEVATQIATALHAYARHAEKQHATEMAKLVDALVRR